MVVILEEIIVVNVQYVLPLDDDNGRNHSEALLGGVSLPRAERFWR
jgi:hypothetical protein